MVSQTLKNWEILGGAAAHRANTSTKAWLVPSLLSISSSSAINLVNLVFFHRLLCERRTPGGHSVRVQPQIDGCATKWFTEVPLDNHLSDLLRRR